MNKPVDFESATTPGVINLGPGQPSSDLLPTELMKAACDHWFDISQPQQLNYGAKQGDQDFLDTLAAFLSAGYACPVKPGSLFLTGGNSQALDLVCERFTQPGDVVFVEEPTYFLAYQIFRDHGLEIVPVPVDGDGMDMARFETLLERSKPRLVYTIPSFHNPTGQSMPLEKRERLVELSRDQGFVIVADEVYQLLHYSGSPPPPLGAWADEGNVLSLGTFSKILAPAIRLGWIQTNSRLMETLLAGGAVSSGGSYNHFASHIVTSAMQSGMLDQHVRFLRDTYRGRVAAMDEALHEHMSGLARWARPDGGYFFWLELEQGVDAAKLREAASERKTGFMHGAMFSLDGGLNNCVRLSFAPYDEADIREGVRLLARVFSSSVAS